MSGTILYLALYQNYKTIVQQFNWQSNLPIMTSFEMTFGSATYPIMGKTFIMDSTSGYLYIGGSLSSQLLLFRISSSSGVLGSWLQIIDAAGPSVYKTIAVMDIYNSAGKNSQMACGQNLGATGYDVAFIDFTDSSSTGLSASSSWYIASTT